MDDPSAHTSHLPVSSLAAAGPCCPVAWDGRCCTRASYPQTACRPGRAPVWLKEAEGQMVTVLPRGWCLCPVCGPGSLGLGCWSSGGSWESQEDYFLCLKGSSRAKRRLKVQSQQGQQAERGTPAEDCWQRFLRGEKERQEECKRPIPPELPQRPTLVPGVRSGDEVVGNPVPLVVPVNCFFL